MTLLSEHREEADAAAQAADVAVSVAETLDELQQVRDVMEAVWGPSVVPPLNLLRAMSFAGSGMLLARRDGQPIAFGLGVLGWGTGTHFHSHQVGVVPGARSSGVGFAIKMAQRAVCLDHGVSEMRWTFDPMLRGNAVFNLVRLGARITEFIPNCYGERNDNFNAGDTTDRVKVSWQLNTQVGAQLVSVSSSAPSLIDVGETVGRSSTPVVEGAVIPVPDGYHALRDANREVGAQWRRAVSVALVDVLDAGLSIAGVSDAGYVVGAPVRDQRTAGI